MDFTHIVSVGGACRVTYQLRRHFNFGLSFPFDWWVTSPAGICYALDPNNDPYRPDNLIEVKYEECDRFQIASRDLAIKFHHDFPREDAPCQPVVANWRQFIDRPRERFMRRRDRLLSLNDERNTILFVRHHAAGTPCDPSAMIAALRNTFARARIKMVFINHPTVSVGNDVTAVHFKEADSPDWKGDDASWSGLLPALGVQLKNKDIPPFSAIVDH